MLNHEIIIIGLLSVLFLFKRSRYASVVYLIPYIIYVSAYSKGWIPNDYYFAASATFNLPIILLLFKDYKFTKINDIFDLNKYTINQLVGLLSIALVFINFTGWVRYVHRIDATIYNSDYMFIVSVQVSLLYIGNMFNAWVDRRNDKRALVYLNSCDYFETHTEVQKRVGE